MILCIELSLTAIASSSPGATYGCRAMRPSSFAISSGGSTKSTAPVAIALRGMPCCSAVASWAKVIPPAALISWMPSVPSFAVPDSTTPMALCPCSSASARMK